MAIAAAGRVSSILRRFRRQSAQEPTVVESPPADEVDVTLWTAAGSRQALARIPANTRVSDLLNDPSTTALFDVPLDELLIVAPPEQPTDPARRLHRPGKLIYLSVGPYEVSGSAHVPAGAEAIAFLLRHRQRFVALRRATIDAGDGREWDVVLVNLSQAHSTRNAVSASGPDSR